MRRIIALILVLLCSFGSWGCNVSKGFADEGRMKIFTSFYPMYFLTQQIAGDKADVILMVPSGAEPHDWEPTPRLAAELQQASMLVYNGAGMETWIEKIVNSIDTDRIRIVEASEGIKLSKHTEDEHQEHEQQEHGQHEHEEHNHAGEYDPHVWVSPLRAKQQAENIFKALAEVDPANRDYYEKNHKELQLRLDKLDSDIREASKEFKSNVIVVSHAAFGYFAQDYGLKQIAIRGVNPGDEPSPSQMGKLADICREYGVKYIFFEKLTSPKLSETLAKEIGAGTLVLNDAAGIGQEDIEAGKDYISVMYENIENLKKALSE
jgi:zinc transport system substrate-binding protein